MLDELKTTAAVLAMVIIIGLLSISCDSNDSGSYDDGFDAGVESVYEDIEEDAKYLPDDLWE